MRLRLLTIVLIVIALGGCAAPPTAELEDAKNQLAAAEQAEAEEYAADVLGEAKALLADAEAEVERQQQAFGPGRSYDAAQEMIAAAVTKAKQAAESAPKVKQMIEEQIATHMTDLGAGLSSGRELLERLQKCRRKSWRSKVDLDESKAWMDDLESNLAEIESTLETGSPRAALADAQAAVENLGQQLADWEKAAADSGC